MAEPKPEPAAKPKVQPASTRLNHMLHCTCLRKLMPGNLTQRYVESIFGETWDLFTRVAGDIPVPGLNAAVQTIDFLGELSNTYKKNLEGIETLRNSLNTFANILKEYGDGDKVKNELTLENDMFVVGVRLKAIAEEFQKHKTLSLLEGKSTVEKLADLVQFMNQTIHSIILRSVLKINEMEMRKKEKDLLENIPRSKVAPSDSAVQKKCYGDTGKVVVSSIESWINGKDTESLYWFKGGPGSGKTTVLKQVADRHPYEPGKQRLAVFYCTRALPASCDTKIIFTTLARSLCDGNLVYRRKILQMIQNLKTPADVGTWSPRKQLKRLLFSPLEEIRNEQKKAGTLQSFLFPVVLVIDALEECLLKEDGQKDVQDLLDGLVEEIKDSEILKVVLSSQPREVIAKKQITHVYDMDSQYLLSDDAKRDLEKYYYGRFKAMCEEDPDLPKGSWPPPDAISRLCRITKGNFIVARTICDLISHAYDSDQMLQKVVNMSEANFYEDRGIMGQLSVVYTHTLNEAIKSRDSGELASFRNVIMTIVWLKTLLSPEDLASILGFRANVLRRMLRDLLPIMVVPERMPGGVQEVRVIRFLQTSFTHYIKSKEMVPAKLYVQPSVQHTTIVYHLFKFLNQTLTPISRKSDFVPKHQDRGDVLEMNEDGKVVRVNRAINYACTQWMYHIGESRSEDASEITGDLEISRENSRVLSEMVKFLQLRMLLCWIAVLSHIRNVNYKVYAPKAIRNAIGWLQRIRSMHQLPHTSYNPRASWMQAPISLVTSHGSSMTSPPPTEKADELHHNALDLANAAREYLDRGDYTLGIDTDSDADVYTTATTDAATVEDTRMRIEQARRVVADDKSPPSVRKAAEDFLIRQFQVW